MSEVSHSTEGSENAPQEEIPVDQMPSILETVAPPPEHQYVHPEESTSRRTTLRLAAAGGILAIGAGVGFLVAGGDSSESAGGVSAETVPESDTIPSTTLDAPETTVITVPETVVDAATGPVFMESFEPQELLGELVSNFHCMFEANPMRTQEECLSYVVGDGSGSLSAMLSNLIIEYNDYRVDHPDFEYVYTAELIDARIDNYQAVILAEVEDPAGTYTNRYTFRRALANIVQPTIEDQTRTIWLLQKTEVLNPGEVSFG